jgi:hypothetical protein
MKWSKLEESGVTEMIDFPSLKLDSEGKFTIESAPDVAYFPLAWLTSPARSKGYITCKKNIVLFHASDGNQVMYKITGYDYDARRFVGEKIP